MCSSLSCAFTTNQVVMPATMSTAPAAMTTQDRMRSSEPGPFFFACFALGSGAVSSRPSVAAAGTAGSLSDAMDRLLVRLRLTVVAEVARIAVRGGHGVPGQQRDPFKARWPEDRLKEQMSGQREVAKLFTKEQRAFYAAHAPDGLGFDRRMVAELWFYPDGKNIVELSTKCAPNEAFRVATGTRAFLAERHVDLG